MTITLTVRSSDQDAILIPNELMRLLNLHEGDQVKAIVDGKTLRLARLDSFLSLCGVLANDDSFDKAIEHLDRGWQAWMTARSA